jgi:hypothetical protein
MNDSQQRLVPVGEPSRSSKTRQEDLLVQSGVEVDRGFRGGFKTHRFVALTEIPLAMVFDVHTLETLSVYDYETDAQIGTSYPNFDFARNMGFTYMAKIGISSEYRFHSLTGNKQNLLATVPTKH